MGLSRIAFASLMAFTGTAAAQAPAQPVQPIQPVQTAPAPAQEGFFRPSADPVITSFPSLNAGVPQPAPEAAALAQQRAEREALERDLDRSRREEAQARETAARATAPMIVSPLDGTAPIVSPLGR